MKHVLDNKISETMTEHIRDNYKFMLELVPPGCHRHNAAEVAIQNFKAHFLSVLAGTADNFLPSLWDKLLPQTNITLNLLGQSHATSTVSAYPHINDPFDYNKMPLGTDGMCSTSTREDRQMRIMVIPQCQRMISQHITITLQSTQLLHQVHKKTHGSLTPSNSNTNQS